MDPLSIASGCAGLIQAIGSLSFSIHAFVRTCREARSDLDRVSRELLSLQTVLELIQEDVVDDATVFPQTLERHVSGIVVNCNSVVTEIQECITKYSSDNRLKVKASWAINGQGDVAKLRSSLEAHRAALELALDMFTLHVTKDIKNDTTEIRNDTTAIKDDTAQILAEIARLQRRLPKEVENDYILQHFLEEMTTYTEQTLDRPYSDVRSSIPPALRPDFDPPHDIHLEDWERTAAKSQENLWKQQNESCEFVSQRQSLPTIESTVRAGSAISSLQNMQEYNTSSDSELGLQDIRLANYEGPARVNTHTAKPMEDEVYYEDKTHGRRLVINYPVAASIRQNIRDQECYESTHNRFTAVTCSPRDFNQLRHPFRPRLFAKPRHIAIVFVLKLNILTTRVSFMHQWNFITAAISQATQRVAALGVRGYLLPWQHTIVLVHFPPSSRLICPQIWDILTSLGVQHYEDDLTSLIARTSSNADLLGDTIESLQKRTMIMMHEYTVQPAAHLHHPTSSLSGTEPLQLISVTGQRVESFYLHETWISAICQALDTQFIVELPEEISISSPGDFFWEMWTCQLRFKTSQDDRVNKMVYTTPKKFLREHKRLLSRHGGTGGVLKGLFSTR